MGKKILIPLPRVDFDPTEAAVPWRTLSRAGHVAVFATPDGKPAEADPVMVTGKGLGLLRGSMRADRRGREAYREMRSSSEFLSPILYDAINPADFSAILLPGGHAPGMREYLESRILQAKVGEFFRQGKTVAAICHGALLAARSRNLETGESVLKGRQSTALPRWLELLAWNLTRLWLGDYYRTYPMTVQEEMERALGSSGRFIRGPIGLARDSDDRLDQGFVVKDGRYLSARWPGDAHRFAHELLKLLENAV